MPSYTRLFLLVEGNDDERFFENVIKPEFEEIYDYVKIYKYAEEKDEKTDNFIKSINSMQADYIFFVDFDNFPCITARKERIKQKHKNIDPDKIIVVVEEIESWYLAGLNSSAYNQLKIKKQNLTDNISKEKFNSLIPKNFASRTDFMIEILKFFSLEEATRKNKSFNYFIEKYLNKKTSK